MAGIKIRDGPETALRPFQAQRKTSHKSNTIKSK
jgi:hypothetical protein